MARIMSIQWVKLISALLVCQLTGALGAMATVTSVNTWYQTLVKPSVTPPSWVFAPVWTLLYLLMGVAVYLVWTLPEHTRTSRLALVMFLVQLVFNGLWSFLFFGLKSPMWGLVDIAFLWLALAITTGMFFKVKPLAGVLLLPYFLWVSFATYLNASIYLLNR